MTSQQDLIDHIKTLPNVADVQVMYDPCTLHSDKLGECEVHYLRIYLPKEERPPDLNICVGDTVTTEDIVIGG